MLRIWVEALWNIFIVSGAPLALIVMQKARHDMNLLACRNFQLLRGSFGKNNVFGDSMSCRETNWSLHSHGLLEAHHGVIEVILNLIIVASVAQFFLVNLVALGVPDFKWQKLINLSHKLVLDWLVLVHIHILHHIVHRNLGCVRCCEVDELDIVKELGISLVFSINLTTIGQKNSEKVCTNFSLFDLFKFFRPDLLEKFNNRSIVLA